MPLRAIERRVMWDIVVILLLLVLCIGFSGCAQAYSLDQWADAIKKVENSKKYPYGIKSIHVRNALEARKACKRTVAHAFRDFVAQGHSPADVDGFKIYLAKRYCPYLGDSIGNINWKRNINWFLTPSNERIIQCQMSQSVI